MTRAECVNVRIRCSMRSELFWREWRGSSSPPSSKPGDCAGSFERPVPFRADPRRLQALIQNSRAASRGGLRLGGLVILFVAHGGPRQGIGGGPVHHAGLDKRERLAGPSVPSFATPYSWVELTPRLSERAGWRTPARGDRSAAPQHQWWLSPNDRKWLEFRDRPQELPSAIWIKFNELPAGNCSTWDHHHITPFCSTTIRNPILIRAYKITGSSSLSPTPRQMRAAWYAHICKRRSRSRGAQSCRVFSSPRSELGSLWLTSSTCSASSPASPLGIRCAARVRSIIRSHH